MQPPKIRATFVLDSNGKPAIGSPGNYLIKLTIDGAPTGTHAVTYRLDETYYDPVREARNAKTDFAEEITSYGDYAVRAKIRTRDGAILTSRDLYEALAETYSNNRDPEVLAALESIRDN